jgi:uncharacterized RDD family membrane protein YckC
MRRLDSTPSNNELQRTSHGYDGASPLNSVLSGQDQSEHKLGVCVTIAVRYAGFWRRFGGYVLVDLPVQVVGGYLLGGIVGGIGGLVIGLSGLPEAESISKVVTVATVLGFGLSWLYSALLESSSLQATLGKRAFGMIVTDLDGRRIGFAQASGRFLGKCLSGLFLGMGFLMILRNEKRQALHDDLAKTLVIRRGHEPDNNQLQRPSEAQ